MADHARIAALVKEKMKEQMKELNERMNSLIDLVKENQAPSLSATNSCFGAPGPNPRTLPDPFRFNRYPGPVVPDQRHEAQTPQHRDHRKQVILDRSPVPKEREFTRLPAAMTIIWPILLKKGLIQKEKQFFRFEDAYTFDRDKSCDFHCGRVGHSLDHCFTLKTCIQNLIDAGDLTFRAWKYCDGNPDLLIVPSLRWEHPELVKDKGDKEIWDTLGQPSGGYNFMVKYSTPPRHNAYPRGAT